MPVTRGDDGGLGLTLAWGVTGGGCDPEDLGQQHLTLWPSIGPAPRPSVPIAGHRLPQRIASILMPIGMSCIEERPLRGAASDGKGKIPKEW